MTTSPTPAGRPTPAPAPATATATTAVDGEITYRTGGGIEVHRHVDDVDPDVEIDALVDALDERRGALFSSSYEYPGRYTRWDIGFVDPPLVLQSQGRDFGITALNGRGRVLLAPVAEAIGALAETEALEVGPDGLRGRVALPSRRFEEEERSRQPSVFTVVRALLDLFGSPEDSRLGLHGAFGYDLAFQFEPTELHHERPEGQNDLVLYLADEILVIDHQRARAQVHRYEFTVPGGATTRGLARATASAGYVGDERGRREVDHRPGEYAALVESARAYFARGDLFEVVPGQMFTESCPAPPSELFRRLKARNPAPYGFIINLGPGRVPGGGLAGDVRAGRGGPGGDLPHLRHHRPGPATPSPTPPRSWPCSTRTRTRPS